jgi:hypothetical protein
MVQEGRDDETCSAAEVPPSRSKKIWGPPSLTPVRQTGSSVTNIS